MDSFSQSSLDQLKGALSLPGPRSQVLWEQEQALIGPGLQAVVHWAKLAFSKGEGAFLEDVDQNRYIDFMCGSGVNSIGHNHPLFVAALAEQLSSLVVSSFTSQARVDMLKTIKQILPPGLERIQLYSSGAEAVEAALRLVKSYTGKFEFLGFWNAFHGKTLGSFALTDASRRGLGPAPSGFHRAPYAYCYRCPLNLKFPTCGFACIELVREVIRHQAKDTLAGIVVEPVQGRAGNIVPPPGYMKALQSVAQEFDALLVADESITGFGRTGTMFASAYDEVVPDVMIVGKGMGNGFPVTGIISSSTIMAASPYSDLSASSSSYGGFPLACKAVDTTIQIMLAENLVARALLQGQEFLQHIQQLASDIAIVGEIRGRGMMVGIELVESKESKRPLSGDAMQQLYLALLQAGLLVMVGGNNLRLYPPLSVGPEVLGQAAIVISNTLRKQAPMFAV